MRGLVYSALVSVDGLIDASDGDSDWATPDEELHRHFNDLDRSMGVHLYGRRMYELMAEFWPTADEIPDVPDYVAEYARIWRAIPKVVFSSTLDHVDWNATLVSEDAVEEVARLKEQSGEPLSVGGTALATSLAAAGLIDEFRFYVMPVIVGAGTSMFGLLGGHIDLDPVEVRQFDSGVVLLRYRRASGAA